MRMFNGNSLEYASILYAKYCLLILGFFGAKQVLWRLMKKSKNKSLKAGKSRKAECKHLLLPNSAAKGVPVHSEWASSEQLKRVENLI